MSTNYIRQITPTSGTTQDIYESVDTRIFRATCNTAAATAAKVATLDDGINFTLAAGVRVAVTFTYGNSAESPTLRVDGSSTGTAKYIAIETGGGAITQDVINTWGSYDTVIFTYNGTYWIHPGSVYEASNKQHGHGYIEYDGSLGNNDITIATGDKLVVTDNTADGKIAKTSLSFNTGTGYDAKYLSQKGTWENIPQTLIGSTYNSIDKEVILTIGSLADVDNTEY